MPEFVHFAQAEWIKKTATLFFPINYLTHFKDEIIAQGSYEME